ncbi:type VI secretion system ATPase TssH, partial [Thiotrichales bacterium HSG1]|nr:type VI secretion system ATPase TssH [Thiotrichales bacterium HSG1]
IQELVDKDYSTLKTAIMEIVGQYFRPEFINRIDDVVVFHPLAKQHIRAIANLQIDYLRQRLQTQNMELIISDTALDEIATVGFDPVYGARPLKRLIQQVLENPLAQAILAGKFAPGDTIQVDYQDDVMRFKLG